MQKKQQRVKIVQEIEQYGAIILKLKIPDYTKNIKVIKVDYNNRIRYYICIDDFHVVRHTGAFELPRVVRRVAKKMNMDGAYLLVGHPGFSGDTLWLFGDIYIHPNLLIPLLTELSISEDYEVADDAEIFGKIITLFKTEIVE